MKRDTQSAILDTAERLFAERGFSEVSLRRIIAAAGVNLASVHYHFGSKEALVDAILGRRIGPLNRERLAKLEEAQRRAGAKGPSLQAILRALLEPVLRFSRDGEAGGPLFLRLMGRAMSDPNEKLQELFLRQFKVVAERFMPAFEKVLPHLPREELYWRLHFMIGGMAHTMTHGRHLELLSGGLCRSEDIGHVLRQLITFAAAGLKAPRAGGRR